MSLPQEIRAIVFDFALVGVGALIFDEYSGLGDKFRCDPEPRYDRHIISNLCLLRFGYLPTLQLTREARDIFWGYNTFNMDWKQLGIFALGFGTPQPTSYFIPRDYIRRLKIDLRTPRERDALQRAYWYGSPSAMLRRLLNFPALQHIELVILMSLSNAFYTNPIAASRVNQIKDVCMKLMRRFGRGFSVCFEAFAYTTTATLFALLACVSVANATPLPSNGTMPLDKSTRSEERGSGRPWIWSTEGILTTGGCILAFVMSGKLWSVVRWLLGKDKLRTTEIQLLTLQTHSRRSQIQQDHYQRLYVDAQE